MSQSYTFLCLRPDGVEAHLDIQAVTAAAVRDHAVRLLREHRSCTVVEVWSGATRILTLDRDAPPAAQFQAQAQARDPTRAASIDDQGRAPAVV